MLRTRIVTPTPVSRKRSGSHRTGKRSYALGAIRWKQANRDLCPCFRFSILRQVSLQEQRIVIGWRESRAKILDHLEKSFSC